MKYQFCSAASTASVPGHFEGVDHQFVSAVRGRDPETALAPGPDAVLLHQPLHSLLTHANALSPQLPPDPRPAIGSAIRRIHCANMHQQRLITQMATPNLTTPAN